MQNMWYLRISILLLRGGLRALDYNYIFDQRAACVLSHEQFAYVGVCVRVCMCVYVFVCWRITSHLALCHYVFMFKLIARGNTSNVWNYTIFCIILFGFFSEVWPKKWVSRLRWKGTTSIEIIFTNRLFSIDFVVSHCFSHPVK